MKVRMFFVVGAALMLGETQAQGADADAGKAMYATACARCHGPAGRGMASFPSIKGKDADYLTSRLKQYRASQPVGPNSALMIPMSTSLTDDDIANLAAFISDNFK